MKKQPEYKLKLSANYISISTDQYKTITAIKHIVSVAYNERKNILTIYTVSLDAKTTLSIYKGLEDWYKQITEWMTRSKN